MLDGFFNFWKQFIHTYKTGALRKMKSVSQNKKDEFKRN